jgi:hypothetical protein
MALARQSADPERDTTGLSHHSPARNPVPFGTPIRGSHFGSTPTPPVKSIHPSNRPSSRRVSHAYRQGLRLITECDWQPPRM